MDMGLGIYWRTIHLLLFGEYQILGGQAQVKDADDRQMEMLNIFMGVCLVTSDTVGWEADCSTNKQTDMRSIPQKVISLDCTLTEKIGVRKADIQPSRRRSDLTINNDKTIPTYPQTIQSDNHEPRWRTYIMGQ
jgi:hypothetical protein